MNKTQLSADEIVAMLRHSSLMTILVEGKTDMNIYRWIEEELNCEAYIQTCGGRDTLFKVFNRRAEYNHLKVVFVADSDRFVYSSIPAQYSSVIFTKGYSIENDLYQGRQIESLLTKAEKIMFNKALGNFILYYACQLDKLQSQPDVILDQHPKCVLDECNEFALKKEMIEGGYIEPLEETKVKLHRDYDLLLRGHSLISLLQIFLSGPNRKPTYSNLSICECCYKLKRSEAMNELLGRIRFALAAPLPKQ